MADDREERVRQRAYRLWEAEGRPDGRHDAHWSNANDDVTREDDGGIADVPLADVSQAAALDPGDARKRPEPDATLDEEAGAAIADSELAEATGTSALPVAAPPKPKRRAPKSPASPARSHRKP